MRRNITLMLSALVILAGVVLNASTAIAEQPASPGQINAWKSQKATLQADQRKAQSERAALPGQQQALRAEIARLQKILDGQTLTGAAATVGGKTAMQGANPFDNRTAQDRTIDNAYAEIVQRNAIRDLRDQERAELARVQARQARLDAEIPARAEQIAQLDRTIAYYNNPLKSELDNQNDRLENYKRQRRSTPDPGLEKDINDAERRINELNELQKQFQEGGGSSDSGGSSGRSGGQPQPQSYGAPAGNSGTGPQSQVPGQGLTGFMGAPPVYGAPVAPRWTDLHPSASSRQRSGGRSGAGSTGNGTAPSTPGAPPPVTQGSGTCAPPCHARLDGSGGCHCPDAAQPSSSGTTNKSPPTTVAQAPTPAQQGVRVNCYGACVKGCLANKGDSSYFAGMCAPNGPCYPGRATPDACNKHCEGYKQDVSFDSRDPIVGVCKGG